MAPAQTPERRRAGASRRRWSPRRAGGALAVVIVGAALLWLNIAVTVAMTLSTSEPDAARRIWPVGSGPRVQLAYDAVFGHQASHDEAASAERLASDALNREPMSGPAVRTLAVARGSLGDGMGADRLMMYAERLTRRDLPIELYLIQRAVALGDVAGALHHYDIALSTQPAARPKLLSVLIPASADEPVLRELVPLLARRPAWWPEYAVALQSATLPPTAFARQIRALRLDTNDPGQRSLVMTSMARLAGSGDYADALALVPGGAVAGLRNGSFEQEPVFTPFDWKLRDDPDLTAYREERAGANGRFVLHIAATGERGDEVATQIALLAPGRYTIGGLTGVVTPGPAALHLAVRCATAQSDAKLPDLLSMDLKGMAARATFTGTFTVPANCPAQWVAISTPPASNLDAWIDDLHVTALH